MDPRGLRSQWAHDTPGESPPAEKTEPKPRECRSHLSRASLTAFTKLVRAASHLPDGGRAGFTIPSHAQTWAQRPFLGVKTPQAVGGWEPGCILALGGRPRYRPRMCTSFKEVTKLVKRQIF